MGSVVKSKDKSQPDYIKIKSDITLKAGTILNLESKSAQLERLDAAEKNGKLSADMASEIRERVNKMPDFVRFEITLLDKSK